MKRGLRITEKFTNLTSESFRSYLNDISQINLFETPQDEADCAFKAANGDENAKYELIFRNLRFVVSVAKKYETENVPISDLISQGNIGLIEAANRFDPTNGNKFISYAVWWVRKEIIEYLNANSRTIRIPTSKLIHISKVNNEVNRLSQITGDSFNKDELYGNVSDLTNTEIDDALEIQNMTISSYDKKIGDGYDDFSLLDTLSSNLFPTDYLIQKEDNEIITEKMFKCLNKTQTKIIKMYFGFNEEDKPMNLNEIGEVLNLSRERIRQIKKTALEKLKFNLSNVL